MATQRPSTERITPDPRDPGSLKLYSSVSGTHARSREGQTGHWTSHSVASGYLKSSRPVPMANLVPRSEMAGVEGSPSITKLPQNPYLSKVAEDLTGWDHAESNEWMTLGKGTRRVQVVHQRKGNGDKLYPPAHRNLPGHLRDLVRTAPMAKGTLRGKFVPLLGLGGRQFVYGVNLKTPQGVNRFVRLDTRTEADLADTLSKALDSESVPPQALADWKRRGIAYSVFRIVTKAQGSVYVQVTYKNGHISALQLDPTAYPSAVSRVANTVGSLFRR